MTIWPELPDPDDANGILNQSTAERDGEFLAIMNSVRVRSCDDPLCLHPAGEHDPVTLMCWVEEQVGRAYVSGDGVHDSVYEPCRCGGWK